MRSTFITYNRHNFILEILVVFSTVIFSIFPSSAKDTDKAPDAFALTDITKKSEETLNEIFRIKKDMENLDDIELIKKEYSDFLKNLNQSKENFLDKEKVKITLARIEEQERVWVLLKNTLAKWLPVVQKRSKGFAESLRTLEEKDIQWQKTLSLARKSKAPSVLVDRINFILEIIKRTKEKVKKTLHTLLIFQSKLAEAELSINEMLNTIEKLKEEAGASLFTLDTPPIWKAFTKQDISSSLSENFSEGVHKRFVVLKHYISNFYFRFIYQLIFFIIFSLLFLGLKRWLDNHPNEDEIPEAQGILEWPVALAFIFTLWLTPAVHPRAPFFIKDLSFFLILFPLLHILPRLLSSFYRKILYFFIFAFFLEEISSLVMPGSLLQRLLSLALTVMAITLLYSLIRYHRISGQVADKVFAYMLQWAGRLALALLGIAFIANIIGSFTLAQFLIGGVLSSALLAFIIAICVLAINQLWDIFLRLDKVQSYRSFSLHTAIIRTRFNKLVYWLAIYWWLAQTLKIFQLYEEIKAAVLSVIDFRLAVGSFAISLADVLIFSITIYLSVLISRFVRTALEEDILRKIKLPRGVAGSISMLTHYIIMIIGFTIAMSAAGIEWSRFAMIVGALGVGIGFGLQDVVNNFISGLILIFERPIKLGDVVELEDLRGNVKRIGIRSSTIRTFEGAEVIVPNSLLISNKVVNWTLSDRMRRISLPVGVAYGTDPKKVIQLLEKVAQKHPDVLEKPEPIAIFMGFGESSLDFELRFWTKNFDDWLAIRTHISIIVHEELAKKGIEIPFPQRDIHIIAGAQEKQTDKKEDKEKGSGQKK